MSCFKFWLLKKEPLLNLNIQNRKKMLDIKCNMQTLVSILVVTYNSVKTVLETLESIKAQTYPHIELIISDDCSSDNTVALCRAWVEKNKKRFVRTEIITVAKNTGTAGNLNRAEAACRGVWIKGIAGDDCLMPDCVHDYMDYVSTHPEATIVFGQTAVFGYNPQVCRQKEETMRQYNAKMAQLDSADQLSIVLNGDCPSAPSVFYKKSLYDSGLMKIDERISLIEDWPKWINLLRHGIRFDFLDKVVVRYRLGGVSTSAQWESLRMFRDKRMIYFYYVWDVLALQDIEDLKQKTIESECDLYQNFLQKCDEVRNIKNSHAYRLGKAIISPYNKIKALLNRSNKS